jgi:hypothetical protein
MHPHALRQSLGDHAARNALQSATLTPWAARTEKIKQALEHVFEHARRVTFVQRACRPRGGDYESRTAAT